MSTENVDCVVIGAGVVGLAIARKLSMQGQEVLVLESEKSFGKGISSRNSEVIHAGIYYPQNSLKALLCVRGKEMLYRYVQERGIAYKRCGKMIVATNETQNKTLEDINTKAIANSVTDLQFLSQAEAQKRETALSCTAALFSPSTGIIDTHNLMLHLLGDIENHDGHIAFSSNVENADIRQNEIALHVSSGNERITLNAQTVINAAGLSAIPLLHNFSGFSAEKIPKNYYAKGNYFSLKIQSPFSHLIYPVPEKAGLGVHLTLDLGGRARFGPDVEWIETIDYQVNEARIQNFYAEIRKYWLGLPDDSLQSDYAGIRPKIHSANEPASDFLIQGPQIHGIPGLVNLLGIESPGLTSCLAIAEEVADILHRS